DGDGYVDIATVGFDSLYILRNSGKGTFAMRGVLPYSPELGRLTSADFNKDGNDDLAAGSPFSENIFIFLSDGEATGQLFAVPTVYAVNTTTKLEHGDFNSDGFEDLVLLDGDHSSFSILTNIGDGTFYTSPSYQTSPYPSHVALADLNSDGKVDMIVGTAGEDPAIEIFENTGATYVLKKSLLPGLEIIPPQFLCAGDFDNDNKIDIAFLDWSTGFLNIMTNAGGWQFNSPSKLPLGGQPRAIVSGDFNADEKQDLAIGNYSSMQVAYNKGGLFFDIVTHGAGYPTSIAHGDFNNDGTPDIVATNFNDRSVSVMLNDGHGQFASQVHYITGDQPNTVAVGDVAGDTNLDIVVANVQEN
ncbi:MAG TPA: VCBS repeat-containing protein, partial [Anaerolineales bacterium]|nr:VCBS repeat-containing protein [Anaerolineales bacterium]